MKNYEALIKRNDLMVEFWWESGDNEFRATARVNEEDEGWTGSGETVTSAIVNAIGAYNVDKAKAVS